jgi:hypothetical protein
MRADETGGGAPSVCGPSTDFESLSHREMLAMLVGVNQRQVTTVATNLTTAGTAIQEIAADLNTHMSNLDWQSTAGDAFRTWGHKVASATYTLADYATTAGTQMSNAGSVLHEVSTSMPAIPEGAVTTAATYRQHKGVYGPFGDAAEGTHAAPGAPTPTAGQYNAAVAEMSAAQTKAADNMIKLGSAYSAATETMGGQQEPEFPPLPEAILPPDPRGVDDASHSEYFGGSSAGARGGDREARCDGRRKGSRHRYRHDPRRRHRRRPAGRRHPRRRAARHARHPARPWQHGAGPAAGHRHPGRARYGAPVLRGSFALRWPRVRRARPR